MQSSIDAEENLFQVADGVTAESLLGRFSGTSLHEHGNMFDSPSDTFVADLVGAYNATHDPDLVESVSWTLAFYTDIDLAAAGSASCRAWWDRATGDRREWSLPKDSRR